MGTFGVVVMVGLIILAFFVGWMIGSSRDFHARHFLRAQDDANRYFKHWMECIGRLDQRGREADAYKEVLRAMGFKNLDWVPKRGMAAATQLGQEAHDRLVRHVANTKRYNWLRKHLYLYMIQWDEVVESESRLIDKRVDEELREERGL